MSDWYVDDDDLQALTGAVPAWLGPSRRMFHSSGMSDTYDEETGLFIKTWWWDVEPQLGQCKYVVRYIDGEYHWTASFTPWRSDKHELGGAVSQFYQAQLVGRQVCFALVRAHTNIT